MPITIVNMKPLESIDPSSVEAERDKDAELAKKQLLEDYPTLRFGQPPADSDTAIPTTPVEPTAPNTFTMRKFAREEPDAPPPEEKGFFSSLGKTVAAKAKQYAADVPLIVHEERQFQNELEASRASVLPGVVTQARMEGKNILDMPQVKAEAQKLGMRPDMYVRGVEKYVNKTDEELQKIADEARKTAEEQKAKAAPLLKRSKDLAGEIMAARPDYAQWSAQGIAFDALSSMPELAATMAAGFVNPAAGVSTMFGLMMPRYYSEARQEGLSRSQAQTYGMLMAAGEAIPETAVIGRMTSVSIRKALKDGMLKTAGKEFVGTGISEGVSEMITEVYQKGVKSGLYNEETTLKQVLEDTAYAGVVGFAMGGPLGAVSGAAQGRRQQPPPTLSTPPGQTTPAGQITPPPAGGGGAPTAGSTPARTPPAGPAAPAAPAAAQGGPALKAGEPAIYKPTSSPGVAVMVTEVNPQTGEVKAVRLDEQGEPMVDDEGQPMLFVASVNEFPAQIEQPAPSPVAPAAPAGGPPPSTVPPAATSTEPTVDIAGQLKDMWNAKTKRRGVYLSPATVAKMQREGTYEVAKAKGQVEENFDGQGGTLIVKSKKDLDEAKAARDGGQTDMQAIVGGLTGAGVAKPNVAKPAVVQRKDETGAVVQQTAVPQEQAAATAAAVAQQPGTVEVVTPEQALAERNAKVQAEIEEPFKLTTPSPVLEEAAKAATFVTRQFDIPAEGKLTKPDVRSIASFIMTAGTTLKAAAVDAKSRGAPDELIAAANKAARGVEKFDRKSENDFFKARGVSESILRTRAQAVSDALQALVDWHNANPTATKAAPAATPKAPKAEKAKQVSKAKEAPAREERRSDETGPRKEVWTAEERKARREAAERASVEKMGTTEKVEAIMRSKVTGLPNRAALEESEKQSSSSAWASVDADSLAYINDNLGHAAGDLYLKRIANVLKRLPGVEAYHVSGDEFIVTADDIMTLKDSVASANELMARAGPVVFEDGSSVTPTISFGTGKTEKLADLDLIKNKQLRRAKGAIAERKQPPPSFRTAERNKQPSDKAAPPVAATEENNVDRVPKEFREPGKFFFHQVRNNEDIPGIVAEGLRTGSNVSMIDGQAISEWDGGIVLVFENDGSLKAKEYQPDSLTTKPVKPIAIIVDTTYAEKPAVVADKALNELEQKFAALEAEKEAMAKTLGLDNDALLGVMVAYPKGDAYQAVKEKLADRPAVLEKLRDLIRRDNVLSEVLEESGEIADAPAVNTVDVLQKHLKHGLPVFSQTGVSLMPTKVSATGVYVAPAGETKLKKKKKYIPPKKRIEQEAEAIEKQVDKAAAPPPVEVLPLAASRVGAADVPLIASELIGLTPAELVNEVEADRSGQLMGVLGTLLEGVQKRNNWMGWYTAVMRGDVMQAQKNTLKGLMRQYIAAEDSEIPGLWEEMLGLMTNVDGKMLPPDAISAIREAANVARAYNEVVTTLREGEWTEEDPESDFREVQSEEVMFDRGILSKDQPGGPGMGTIAEGEGGSTAAKKRKPLLNVARQLLESARGGPLFVGLRDLASEVRADVRLSNLVVESMTGKRVVSSREFGAIITEVAQKSGSSNVRLVGSLLERIIRFAPNVPLEFVRPGGTMLSVRGKPIRNAAGSYSAEGILKIRLSRAPDSRAPVTVDINMLQTFVHEYVHAATVYELRAHPDGPLAKRLTEIREDLLKQAERKFGAQKVRDVMDWYSRAGSSTAPAPAEESTIGQFIYALTNNDELVAESFSSPEFHEFVKGLSATPRWYYQNKFIAPIARALSKLFGRPTQVGQFGKVLSELLRTTDRVMQAQYARQARISRKANDIQSILETRLGFDPATASDLTRSMLSVHNRENVVQHFENAQIAAGGTGDIMPSDVILDAWGDTRLVRGDPRDKEQLMYDRYAFRAYNRTPEELMRTVDHMRNVDPGYLDNYYGRPDFQRLSDAATPALAKAAAAMEWLSKTRLVGKTKETIKGLPSLDFVVRRSARFFGSPLDPNNPLNAWKRVRDMRRSYANQLLEMAESTVNAKWMQLSPTESARTGHMLQQSTLWQIDPRLGEKQTRPRYFGKRAWEAKRVELEKLWTEMTPEEQEVYSSVQTYFKQEYARIRRAAVDLAVDMVGSQLSPVQKSMLYGIRNQESVDRLIGSGKLVDIGEGNDRFAKVLKEVIRVSSIQGPYFPLFRQGDYVVEAEGKGILGDEEPILFATKEEAEAAADEVRSMSPKNKAKVIDAGNGFNVSYTVREVSFHESQNEAAAALADLKARGLAPKDGVYSRKLSDIGAASMTESLKELQSHAQKLAESNKDNAAAQVVAQTIEQAFLELLAQKAASASQQLKRQGVAGFKPAEAHQTFATRVRGSSWHYANLKTAIAQTKALNRLTTASRDMSMPTPSDITPQQAVIERGRVVNEIRERLRIEAAELDVMDRSAIASGQVLAMLGFANFLATPSYAYINAMQNVNVAMPVITAKYGGKGGKALVRAMGVVIGPTMTKAMRGLVSKPGNVTSYDVYSSIHDALKDHPRYGKYVQGDNSAMQQLVDLGVINASFVQELSAVANNRNRYVARGLEYLRLLPQGMELWNRITTSLAVLDSTNGNVQAAADMVNQVHFDYTLENRPRFFRSIHGFRMPQALTMFKMYSVGMYQLTGSLIVDAVSRRGQSVEDRARAATALAGIIAAHVVSAGVMRGLMVEPLRALVNLFWALRSDDDDEFKDIDTAVQRWAAEVSDNEAVRRGLSKGLWAALGFDLSSRMGLDRMIIFNPPEGISEDKMWKFVGQFGGPIPAMIIQKAAKSNEYWNQGKPFEAITELIPLRILQDVRKAWKIVNEGITTKAGATILPAEDFGWVDALGTAAGFRTTEAAKVSDMASTEFSYKGWKKKRVGILVGAYTRAYRDNDQKALDKAMADIMRFNELNPNDPITGRSIAQSWRSQETAVLDRQGEGRNQALQELMDY